MRGYLVIHFVNRASLSLEIGEPTVKRFFNAVEIIEEMWSQVDGFADSELIHD